MTVLENEMEIGRKKNIIGSYYEEAKKAIASNNIEQAIDLTEQGRIQAELENYYEWVQRFYSFNSAIKSKPSLNTTIAKEIITIMKGIGPFIAPNMDLILLRNSQNQQYLNCQVSEESDQQPPKK